jgi:diacylglycerol kinase family enzyme
MRVLLMSNPSAGENGFDARDLTKLLESEGHAVIAQSVKEDGWEDALSHDVDLVVAAGGDGTVAKVFKKLAGREKVATILPIGSANNIATSLGYEEDDQRRLVRDWPRAERRRFDIGSLRGDTGSLAFVESAGGGVFAEMLVRADEIDSTPGGEAKVNLGLRLLLEIVTETPALEWTIQVDGVDVSGEFLAVEAMNTGLLGPNVPLAPAADSSDRMLDLMLVRTDDRAALAAHAKARLEQRSPPPLEIDVRRGRQIMLQPSPPTALHYDDDLVDKTDGNRSFRVSVDSALDVLVPSADPSGES